MRTSYSILLTVFMTFLQVVSAQAGPNGSLPLLKIAPDARSAALGEAGTAGSGGAAAAFHNPALLSFSETSQASFAYTDWLLDLSIQSGALLFHYSRFSWGLSFSVFTTPGIERRVLPADDPIETFDAHDLSAGLSCAYRLTNQMALGLTARYLYQQISVEEASGIGVDLGVAYHLEPTGIIIAGAIRNAGRMDPLQKERSPLPTSLDAGLSGLIITRGDFGLRGLGDLQYFTDDDLRLHAGLEGSWKGSFFLRAGYQSGSDLRSFSGGAGLSWRDYHFDYAYQPFSEDFEASHRFTLTIDF